MEHPPESLGCLSSLTTVAAPTEKQLYVPVTPAAITPSLWRGGDNKNPIQSMSLQDFAFEISQIHSVHMSFHVVLQLIPAAARRMETHVTSMHNTHTHTHKHTSEINHLLLVSIHLEEERQEGEE